MGAESDLDCFHRAWSGPPARLSLHGVPDEPASGMTTDHGGIIHLQARLFFIPPVDVSVGYKDAPCRYSLSGNPGAGRRCRDLESEIIGPVSYFGRRPSGLV